jgi:hypothetical protein
MIEKEEMFRRIVEVGIIPVVEITMTVPDAISELAQCDSTN